MPSDLLRESQTLPHDEQRSERRLSQAGRQLLEPLQRACGALMVATLRAESAGSPLRRGRAAVSCSVRNFQALRQVMGTQQ